MNFKRLLTVSTMVVVGVSMQCFASLTTKQDKLSYAMGFEAGKSFASHKMQINPTVFAKGLLAALKGQPSDMSESEIKTILVNYQKEMMQKFQAKIKKEASENETAEKVFLAKNKQVKGVTTTASGLQYRVINAGKGVSPTEKDTVTVNYKVSILNGTVFDSSYKRGKPATFPVKAVIPGWQEALKLMKPGAKWELFIPAKLAYGKMGAPGTIPPNSLLQFTVDLIKVNSQK